MHTSVRTRALQCPNSGICDAPQQITYMGLCHAQQTEIRHNCCNPDPAKCRGPQKKPTLFCPVLSFPLHWATWLPFTGVRAVCGARVPWVVMSLFLPP